MYDLKGKEVCRFMSRPMSLAQVALKKLTRYLRARPRMVFEFERQVAEGLEVYSDTDWAGCPRTRKSTTGGCAMVGSHLIKAWSSTQASVALSSGEAEYYGPVHGVMHWPRYSVVVQRCWPAAQATCLD